MRESAAADRISVMTAYRKILVGYDDSEQAHDALALGRQLADVSGAALVVGGVFPLDPIWGSSIDPYLRETEANYARQVEEAARAVGAEAEAFASSSAAHGLHDLAEKIGADLIVVGSSHRSRAGQALAGSVGTTLLHGAGSAVAVASRGFRDQPAAVKTIVIGFDGSPEAGQALVAAWQLAKQAGATLKLISVAVPPPLASVRTEAGRQELLDAIRDSMRETLTEARKTVPDGIELETTLITGDPVEALKDVAGAPGTILVVGSRGYGPVRRVLLGSVSGKLVAGAPCPVLVTPRGIDERRPQGSPAEIATAS
jgi:nucleotide-binding universal stress UspA family protein